jgi:3-oxoacyl-[acyl-carrier-protein] synthase II
MSEMACLATLQALNQAGITLIEHEATPRTLLCLGSTTGSPINLEAYFKKFFERHGPEGQMGTSFFKVMNHSVTANVAAALGFHGPAFSPSSACATSAQAMIMGWELIQSGIYDTVIAGGADELHHISCAVFDTVLAASRGYNSTPTLTPRPFDLKRDGLVVSEGAGIIIMESESGMKRRNAKPLAEFKGGAYLCDGRHMSQSSEGNMIDVMTTALERSKINASEVQYVNAHATGTIQGDVEEAKAIGKVVGSNIPVSSLKGHFGHSMAACGTLELISAVKMMEKSVLIPTRNLDQIDPACSDILHVQARKDFPFGTFMSNNFAFGGINTSLIVSAGNSHGG